MTAAITRRAAGGQSHDDFVGAMNGLFSLDHLRAFEAADMGEADEASMDFDRLVGISRVEAVPGEENSAE